MSMIAAAVSAGASLIKGRQDRKQADEQAAAGGAAAQAGVDEMQKGISKLDDLQPAIDRFAGIGQDQFDKYQRMLGPMEDSLNNYYSNLNPDELASQGNQTAQQQYQNTMNQVNDQLAAQGIQNSGVSSQMALQQGNQMAQTKAQNIMNAPGQVAQEQQGWLNYSSGQANQAYGQMQSGLSAQQNQANAYNNAYANMANIYGGQAAQNNQMAQHGYQMANQTMESGMELGAALGEQADWKW